MSPIAVETTVATREQAQAIARALVERGLVACVHIIPVDSVYRWQGTLQEDHEFLLRCKTRRALYPAVEAAIRELHAYDLPDIHAVALEAVYPPYARWVEDNTPGPPPTE